MRWPAQTHKAQVHLLSATAPGSSENGGRASAQIARAAFLRRVLTRAAMPCLLHIISCKGKAKFEENIRSSQASPAPASVPLPCHVPKAHRIAKHTLEAPRPRCEHPRLSAIQCANFGCNGNRRKASQVIERIARIRLRPSPASPLEFMPVTSLYNCANRTRASFTLSGSCPKNTVEIRLRRASKNRLQRCYLGPCLCEGFGTAWVESVRLKCDPAPSCFQRNIP